MSPIYFSLESSFGSRGVSSQSSFDISCCWSVSNNGVVMAEFEEEEWLNVSICDWSRGFRGNISFTCVIVRVVESITPNELSFEVIPDRANGIINLTFFGPETIDTLFSFPVRRISSAGFCDAVESNWPSAAVITLFSVQNW